MGSSLKFNSRTLQEQVTDEFVDRVISGVWKPGEVLRNEVDLSRELGVSIGTVRKAFEILAHLKLIVRSPGKGTTVVDLTRMRATHSLINTRDMSGIPIIGDFQVSNVHVESAGIALAAVFGVTPESNLIRFERKRVYRNRVFMKEVVNIPFMSEDELTIEERAEKLWFDHDVIVDKQEIINAIIAKESDTEIFKIEVGAPMFKTTRIIYGYRSLVLEHRVGKIHVGDDLQFVMGSVDPKALV